MDEQLKNELREELKAELTEEIRRELAENNISSNSAKETLSSEDVTMKPQEIIEEKNIEVETLISQEQSYEQKHELEQQTNFALIDSEENKKENADNTEKVINLETQKKQSFFTKSKKGLVAVGLVGALFVGGLAGSAYTLTSMKDDMMKDIVAQIQKNGVSQNFKQPVNLSSSAGDQTKAVPLTDNSAIIADVMPSVVTIGIKMSPQVEQQGAQQQLPGGFSIVPGDGNGGGFNIVPGNGNGSSGSGSSDGSSGSGNNSNKKSDDGTGQIGKSDIDAEGTGIIFKEDAGKVYIVTNNHVVAGAQEARVWLDGQQKYVNALLVGQDSKNDLAVISINKSDLANIGVGSVKLATFGDSDKINVGDPVIAIGDALGEGISSTGGMVSMKDKKINLDAGQTLSVIQIDASLNHGNSGGPLVDKNGNVIGINTAKLMASTQESVEGMGYSIPSNAVQSVVDDIIANMDKPFLGITGTDISPKIAEAYSLPSMGAVVVSIIDGGSASESDLKVNDIITSMNGQTVQNMDSFSKMIKACKVGDKIDLKVFRDGNVVDVSVTLKKHEDSKFS